MTVAMLSSTRERLDSTTLNGGVNEAFVYDKSPLGSIRQP